MEHFDDLTTGQIEAYIAANVWTFAKSMPKNPHEYNLKVKSADPEIFERFVMHIRQHGHPRRFYGVTFMYFDVGQNEYWTMGNPLSETKLINRARINKDAQ